MNFNFAENSMMGEEALFHHQSNRTRHPVWSGQAGRRTDCRHKRMSGFRVRPSDPGPGRSGYAVSANPGHRERPRSRPGHQIRQDLHIEDNQKKYWLAVPLPAQSHRLQQDQHYFFFYDRHKHHHCPFSVCPRTVSALYQYTWPSSRHRRHSNCHTYVPPAARRKACT